MFHALLLLLAASATFDEVYRAGLLALQHDQLSEAQTNLEAAATMAPDNGRVWIALAQTYWKLKVIDRANTAAAKAETAGAKDSLVQSTLATYYTETGQPLKSAAAQARFASLVPKDAKARERAEAAYFELAQPLLQEGKFADAIGILEAGSKNVKDSAQLELALGVAYYGLRRFDEAATAFLRTIEIAPALEQPYVFLGKFLDQIPSRANEVAGRFVQYEAANPASAVGYYLHAKALNAKAEDAETARKLLEKALSIDDRNAAAHFEMGVVFDRVRRWEDAAREFERAAELAPQDPAAHYRLARVYERMGKTEAARIERERHAKLEDAARSGR
jgi:tetratricopeptide (TPR) repeat protein